MRKLNNEEFDLKLNNILGKEYKRIGEYKDTKSDIEILHIECNKTFPAKSYNLLQGYGCPHCNKKIKKEQKEFEDKIFELVGSEYSVLGEYKGYHKKVKMIHNTCKHEYDVKAGNFTSIGRRCPKCSGLIKKDKEFVQKCLDELYPNEFKVICEYKNNVTPIEIVHLECNKSFKASLKNIQKGKFSCSHCNMTSGELFISNILKENNISYDFQYVYNECKDKKVLPFDFRIISNNEDYIIEYDGRQHFLPIFGSNDDERKKNLEITKKHDEIKNSFCENSNIHILRIKYDLNLNEIPNIIKTFLNI